MKILPSALCLCWHPIKSLYQASSLSHILNIQLPFKSTPPCSSFVVVYLRCCSMFMECSFTGKIPWPKPSKGTTHLGSIFHDTHKALAFWERWFPLCEHKPSLKYLKLGNQKLQNWSCTWPLEKVDSVCICLIRSWQVSAILLYKDMKLRQNWNMKDHFAVEVFYTKPEITDHLTVIRICAGVDQNCVWSSAYVWYTQIAKDWSSDSQTSGFIFPPFMPSGTYDK